MVPARRRISNFRNLDRPHIRQSRAGKPGKSRSVPSGPELRCSALAMLAGEEVTESKTCLLKPGGGSADIGWPGSLDSSTGSERLLGPFEAKQSRSGAQTFGARRANRRLQHMSRASGEGEPLDARGAREIRRVRKTAAPAGQSWKSGKVQRGSCRLTSNAEGPLFPTEGTSQKRGLDRNALRAPGRRTPRASSIQRPTYRRHREATCH
jgi:hypothetical protein